jgi:hypothetical protein
VLGRPSANVGERHNLVTGRWNDRSARRWGRAGRRRRCSRGRSGCHRLGGRRGRRRRRSSARVLGVDVGEHVLTGDPTTEPGPPDLRGVDAVVGEEAPHHRRQQQRFVSGGSVRCRRSGGEARRSGRRWRRWNDLSLDRLDEGRRGWRRCGRGRWRCRRFGCRRWGRRRCRRRRRRRRRSGGRRGSRFSRGPTRAGLTIANHGKPGAHLDRLALWDDDLSEDTRRRRGDLGVHLVGRDFEQRLVALHLIADRFHPAGDRALGDGLSELWHRDVSQRGAPFQ